MNDLRQFLEQMHSFTRALGRCDSFTRALGRCDSFEGYVLREGRAQESQELTPDEMSYVMNISKWMRFPIKQCFHNSQMLLIRDSEQRLTYMEGYCAHAVLPVLHGWLAIGGKVVDVTMRRLCARSANGYRTGGEGDPAMSYKIEKGKLWLDGSGRVSVGVALDTFSGLKRVKLLLLPEDSEQEVWMKLRVAAPDHSLNRSAFDRQVLECAQAAREDPEQLRELEKAVKRIQKGAAKSRDHLLQRVRTNKEAAFKKAAQDLMDRGLTKSQLFQLIREAVVEGVHEK